MTGRALLIVAIMQSYVPTSRWTAAFQHFAHVSPHTALSHGHLVQSPTGQGGASDHVVTAEVAEALVAVITDMTKVGLRATILHVATITESLRYRVSPLSNV